MTTQAVTEDRAVTDDRGGCIDNAVRDCLERYYAAANSLAAIAQLSDWKDNDDPNARDLTRIHRLVCRMMR